MNRLRHGISYTKLEEYEAVIVKKQIERQQDGIVSPSNCQHDIPVTLVWDNNDLLEETLSGRETKHFTNGIVIKRLAFIVVFDLTIYIKELKIMWYKEEEMNRVVFRMGAFHMCCTLLAMIGKRFGDAELSNIVIESAVIAAGSLPGILEGKHGTIELSEPIKLSFKLY